MEKVKEGTKQNKKVAVRGKRRNTNCRGKNGIQNNAEENKKTSNTRKRGKEFPWEGGGRKRDGELKSEKEEKEEKEALQEEEKEEDSGYAQAS